MFIYQNLYLSIMGKLTIEEIKEYIRTTPTKCSYKFIVLYILLQRKNPNVFLSNDELKHFFKLFFLIRKKLGLLVEVKEKCNPLSSTNITKVLSTPLNIFIEKNILNFIEQKKGTYYSINFTFHKDILDLVEEKIITYFTEKCQDNLEESKKLMKIFQYHLSEGLTQIEFTPEIEKHSLPLDYKKVLTYQKQIFTEKHFNSENAIYDKSKIDEMKDLLINYKQIILYGPPGTGKTYLAQLLAQIVANNRYEIVQFHPSYAYEDFVEGIDAVLSENNQTMTYQAQPRIFRKLCQYAINHPKENVILIIDEINRGDLSRIFGELILGLEPEYRGNLEITTPLSRYLNPLVIPKNLLIIGTMNSLDRSIAIVDYALRRRFLFYKISPDGKILRKWHEKNQSNSQDRENSLNKLVSQKYIKPEMTFSSVILGIFEKLNSNIKTHRNLGENYQIGHTYFFVQNYTQFHVYWKYKIHPILEEYLNFDENEIKKFTWGAIMEELYAQPK